MRPTQVATALKASIAARQPAFVWGDVGVGKSDVIAQVTASQNKELRDVRLNLLDITDIKGFPVPDTKKKLMTWLPPEFFPTKGEGILFLDEMNQAMPAIQAAAYQLLLNRRIGEYELPDGWDVIAAGNRTTDRANAQKMPSGLGTRVLHLDFEVNVEDWTEWALDQGDAIPVELLAFIRFRPDLLHAPNKDLRTFPCPRTWTFAGKVTNQAQQQGLPAEVEFEMYKGSVSEAAAGEYKSFLDVFRELPSVDQIKLDPDGTPISDKPAVRFAITAALAHASTKDVFPRFMKYIERMEPEWQIAYVRDAQRRSNRSICETKEYTKFAVKHSHLLA